MTDRRKNEIVMIQVNADRLSHPSYYTIRCNFFVDLCARAIVIVIIVSSRGPRESVTLDDVVDSPGRGPLFKRGHGA